MALGFPHQFYFGCLQNLTPGTYQRMIEHSSHCAIAVTNDDVNDEISVIECILCHFLYSRSLHTFRASIEVLWALMFFYFFSSLFCRVTLPEGLGIEDHSDDPLAPCTDDEGISAGGVISPSG